MTTTSGSSWLKGLGQSCMPMSDTTLELTASALALWFAAAEEIGLAELACGPLVQNQYGVKRWPSGSDRHLRPYLQPSEVRSPIFSFTDFRRFYSENGDGLVIRDFHHPAGRFAISVHGSSLRVKVGLAGKAAVFRAVGRLCTVHIPQQLPADLRLSLKGKNLNDVWPMISSRAVS